MICGVSGYNDVSWTNPSIHTPVLENLARDGVILSQFYTQPKCSPSRSALMTGRYPYKISTQRGSIGPFRPTGLATVFPTLPELLKRQGYSTHLVGKCNQRQTTLFFSPLFLKGTMPVGTTGTHLRIFIYPSIAIVGSVSNLFPCDIILFLAGNQLYEL